MLTLEIVLIGNFSFFFWQYLFSLTFVFLISPRALVTVTTCIYYGFLGAKFLGFLVFHKNQFQVTAKWLWTDLFHNSSLVSFITTQFDNPNFIYRILFLHITFVIVPKTSELITRQLLFVVFNQRSKIMIKWLDRIFRSHCTQVETLDY